MRIVTVVGARPQFVKAAVVSRLLRARAGITEILVHTGQHYDAEMSELFFSELELPSPEVNLGIGSAAHGAQTGRMLQAVERVLLAEKPDATLVYGDTNSTLAGALAAAKLHIPVAHVEAGMRSFNRRMPEEINRVVTDHVSELLFASTPAAVAHLRNEGIPQEGIHLVGDVMYDAARYYADRAEKKQQALSVLGLQAKQYILATVHRAENTDEGDRLRAIVGGLARLAGLMPVVLPLHPRTAKALQREGLVQGLPAQVKIIPPASYLEMIELEKNACVIATDSGGVQKEAFFYRVPCVTLRDETEWTELVEIGANRVCSPRGSEVIERAVRAAISDGFPAQATGNLYGNGKAAQRIVAILTGRPSGTTETE